MQEMKNVVDQATKEINNDSTSRIPKTELDAKGKKKNSSCSPTMSTNSIAVIEIIKEQVREARRLPLGLRVRQDRGGAPGRPFVKIDQDSKAAFPQKRRRKLPRRSKNPVEGEGRKFR